MRTRIWGTLVLVFTLFAGCDSGKDEVTVYPLWCDNGMLNGHCKDGKITMMPRRVYRAFPERQVVVKQFLYEKEPVIWDMTGCTVRDGRNWHCDQGGTSLAEGMVDGKYVPVGFAPDERTIEYVSRARWWFAKLTGTKTTPG
jgi:hypothetical protein